MSFATSSARSSILTRRSILRNAVRYTTPRQQCCSIHTVQASSLPLSCADHKLYTSGNWLHLDSLQRQARHIDFDLNALLARAVEACPGAQKVISYEKQEGGFNRAFIIHMNNDVKVVARLPTRVAGPPRLTTNSEVATLSYLAANTDLPVPKVLAWSDSTSGPVGAEYIIMEHVAGVPITEKWHQMRGEQHIQFIRAIGKYMRKLGSLSFPAYGSLYFSDTPLATATKYQVNDEFCIGPHCGVMYWDCSVDETKHYHWRQPNRGPWSNFANFAMGLIDLGYSYIPEADYHSTERLPYQGSVREHLDLLETSHQIIKKSFASSAVRDASVPTLWHPDLHMRNIYVSEDDPTMLTGIIDWQSTSVEPALIYALETPDFARLLPYDRDIEGKRDRADTAEEEKLKIDTSLCNQAWEVFMRFTPNMNEARTLDKTIARLFIYCHMSWDHSAAAVRSDLIDISQRWHDMGLPGKCPYSPGPEELAMQVKHYEDYESVHRLRAYLARAFYGSTDGWVPPGKLESAKETHKALYQGWMHEAEIAGEEGMTAEKAAKMWPWDDR